MGSDLSCQSFNKEIKKSVLELPDEKVSGFETSIDFSRDDVRLNWWKYAKKFSLPKNQRTHYEVTIPSTDSSKPMTIFTQALGEEKPIKFKLAVANKEMTEEEKSKFEKQAQFLLLDFKRWVYLRHYEEQLKKLEQKLPSKSSTNWNTWIDFIEKRNQILSKMKEI